MEWTGSQARTMVALSGGEGMFGPGCRELKEWPPERAVTTVPGLGAAPKPEVLPGRQ